MHDMGGKEEARRHEEEFNAHISGGKKTLIKAKVIPSMIDHNRRCKQEFQRIDFSVASLRDSSPRNIS